MKNEDIEKLKEINTTLKIYIDCIIALRRRIDNQELRILSLELKEKREIWINKMFYGLNVIIQLMPWIVIALMAWVFYKLN